MAPLLERKLRFSDVVYAIDTSPKALRNWLQREQVEIISERSDGTWQQFSKGDVAVLALVRRLVDFGIRVETASRMARTILIELQGVDWLERDTYLNDAIGFSMFWVNRAVLIYPAADDQWNIRIWDMWQPFPDDAPEAAIVLKPEHTLRTAFERAAEGSDASDDDVWDNPDTVAALQDLLTTLKGIPSDPK